MANAVRKIIETGVMQTMTSLANFNRKFLREPKGGNPYLTGLHAPMEVELDLTELEVEGDIPTELDGRYLRIGPNPITQPDPASHHWFVGDGMAHGLRLKDGRAVWYRNRWIRSNKVSAVLGEEPKPGHRNPRSDTANTNIVGIADRTFALVEAGGKPVELDFDLDTVAHNPFDGSLKNSFSAHPHFDPATGEAHAICYEPTNPNAVWHTVLDKNGQVTREEPIPVQDGPSVHDCQITKNYVLVFDLPAIFSKKRFLAGYDFPYEWNPSHPARLGLLPRNGSGADIIWCAIEDPCYVYHPANAFETEDGQVVVDVVVHESSYAESAHGPGGAWARFERWTADPIHQTVTRKILHDVPQEFPRYDERRTCEPYRYAYTIELEKRGPNAGERLFKHDLYNGTTIARHLGDKKHPGEFVFVPRHSKAAEDEGWLIGLVIDANSDQTALFIINADDFEGKPQAIIKLPHRIPPGFHGNWVAAA
jgi:carotenoid cleavage dioxygenase-like enzyme